MIYRKAHAQLVMKMIEELLYEELISLSSCESGGFSFFAGNSQYRFKGHPSVWGHAYGDYASLQRYVDEQMRPVDAIIFIKEVNSYLDMDDKTLAYFCEEALHTLYSESERLKKVEHLKRLSELSSIQLDQLSPGHPKLLLNKGRLGMGSDDLVRYMPESQNPIRFLWIAVDSQYLVYSKDELVTYNRWLEKILGKSAFNAFLSQLKRERDFVILAVHPWQWQRYIKIHYATYICEGTIVELGNAGPDYYAQTSLRTLSCSDSSLPDIKTSLSVLNTSSVRGIAAHYMQDAPSISRHIRSLADNDSFLNGRLDVICDIFSASFENPYFAGMEGRACPYRFRELLGMVARESAASKLSPGQTAYSGASLLLENEETSLIEELLEHSQLSLENWLACFFDNVSIPLYHLMAKYRIGHISHGQNIVIVFERGRCVGVMIKDFHGDLRKGPDVVDPELKSIESLELNHLIHDFYTGHIVTYLRFLGKILRQRRGFSEQLFYRILSRRLKRYEQTVLSEGEIPSELNLFNPQLEKVLVNKVRFVVGYDESAQRPRPLLGKKNANPLSLYGESYE